LARIISLSSSILLCAKGDNNPNPAADSPGGGREREIALRCRKCPALVGDSLSAVSEGQVHGSERLGIDTQVSDFYANPPTQVSVEAIEGLTSAATRIHVFKQALRPGGPEFGSQWSPIYYRLTHIVEQPSGSSVIGQPTLAALFRVFPRSVTYWPALPVSARTARASANAGRKALPASAFT
jgi:hypothetical protein